MCKIVGLSEIKKLLGTYSLDNFPHSVILLGRQGSGKHVIVDMICEKFKFNLIDISKELSDELIDNIYTFPNIQAYMMDLRIINEKSQNILLKLFEEPPVNAFIFVLANNSNQVLPTILNRGFKLFVPNYSFSELEEFAKGKNIELDFKYNNLIKTPGDILTLYSNNTNLEKLEDLTEKITDKLSVASYTNTLTIANKLNYSDEYDKFDVNFFLELLCMKYYEKYIEGELNNFNLYNIVNTYKKRLTIDPRLNKKILISNMLGKLWLEVKNGTATK